jgi:hypothetical protein
MNDDEPEIIIISTRWVVCWSLAEWQGYDARLPPRKEPNPVPYTNEIIETLYQNHIRRMGGL